MKIVWGIFDFEDRVIKIFDTKEECEDYVVQEKIDYKKIIWGEEKGMRRLLRMKDKGWTWIEGKGWIKTN